jgi:hypothetical protein
MSRTSADWAWYHAHQLTEHDVTHISWLSIVSHTSADWAWCHAHQLTEHDVTHISWLRVTSHTSVDWEWHHPHQLTEHDVTHIIWLSMMSHTSSDCTRLDLIHSLLHFIHEFLKYLYTHFITYVTFCILQASEKTKNIKADRLQWNSCQETLKDDRKNSWPECKQWASKQNHWKVDRKHWITDGKHRTADGITELLTRNIAILFSPGGSWKLLDSSAEQFVYCV